VAPYRILLADDDPQIRAFLQAILTARNYLVDQATDGIDALDMLRKSGSAVDLLITDIKMPRMDGVALARAVGEMFPAMPVLFISGWAEPVDAPEWRHPRYAFLLKPFLPKVLMNCVEQLIARSAANAAAANG
jgi:two-component system cell cycle sensor histidine kinase/response regulator CckA